jgi:phospholipase A1
LGVQLALAAELDPDCVLRLAGEAQASMTLAELRALCRLSPAEPVAEARPAAPAATGNEAPPGPFSERLAAERAAAESRFSIMAHKPNYFLAAAWNADGWNPPETPDPYPGLVYAEKDIETQFQISLKVPLLVGWFGDRVDVYGAYTNRSFWQVYDRENSEPFRETNHEPELWLQFRNDWTVFGFRNSLNAVGVVHQSNGRSGPYSRSWNRVFAEVVFERGDWAFLIKPWLWAATQYDEADNPDIDDYMGYGEFRAIYGRSGHVFSAMLRNQLESGFDRGAVELSWSFPVFDYPYLRGYLQYFYGYGESLIDYNQQVNRLGIGISVTDWLD